MTKNKYIGYSKYCVEEMGLVHRNEGNTEMERLAELKIWLSDTLNVNDFEMTPASSDASFRRYFRIVSQGQGQTLIAMDAPPPQEDTRPFIKIADLLAKMGLNVPIIKASNEAQGYLLITDLGNQQYLDHLSEDNVDRLYADAIQSLLLMQKGDIADASMLPAYDHTLLMREMELFREWFLKGQLALQLSSHEEKILDAAFEILAQSALAQPQVLVHRDYHSRNLMVTQENNPGILDFQDAVTGPITYDLVSLLKDCYIKWPKDKVNAWAMDYMSQAINNRIMHTVQDDQFIKWFDLMGIQRHLKATGIFSRLNKRDQKPAYLNDIPRTMSYVIEASENYAELLPLLGFLQERTPSLFEGKIT